MKKITMAILMVLVVISVTVQAQTKPLGIYVGGGVTFPNSEFDDLYKTGYHATGRLGLTMAPRVAVLLGMDWQNSALDKDGWASMQSVPVVTSSVDGGDMSMFMFAGDIKLNLGMFGTGTSPFVFAGIGVATISVSDIVDDVKASDFDSRTKLFVEFGGGLEFNRLLVQGKYVSINNAIEGIVSDDSSANFFCVTLGVKL